MATNPIPPEGENGLNFEAVGPAENAIRDSARERDRRKHDPHQEDRWKRGAPRPAPQGVFRSLGLGLITGAADDDPSAIGTYATAGAKLGPSFLWVAPVTLPMMFAVVYLSSKIGQVSGRG